MAFVPAVPLSSAVRHAAPARCALARSAFVMRPQRAAVARAAPRRAPRMEFEISEGVEFELNPIVFALAVIGWVVPSSIPTSIPLTNGTGLTQAFFASIQENLAHWPKGPALEDPFWLLFTLWHLGMFATLIFGTIGYNGRKSAS